jgi:hypothetical protein
VHMVRVEGIEPTRISPLDPQYHTYFHKPITCCGLDYIFTFSIICSGPSVLVSEGSFQTSLRIANCCIL